MTTPGSPSDDGPKVVRAQSGSGGRRRRRAQPMAVGPPSAVLPGTPPTDGAKPQPHAQPSLALSRAGSASPGRVATTVGSWEVDGAPGHYHDGVEWLRNGARRHPWGVLIALITGWTGVWVGFWTAILGMIFGILVASGVVDNSIGLFLIPIGAGQAVTVLSVFWGAILGALGGFLIVPTGMFATHPIQTVVAVASGAVVTAIVVVTVATFERPLLRARGYRRLSRDEVRRVAPLVKNVADAMDLPALPRFGMADILVPNAWTHMRTIVLTTGLLHTLDDSELTAVLAHELQHWRSGDAVGSRIVWAAALPVALICNLGLFLSGRRLEATGSIGAGIGAFIAALGWLIAYPAWAITKLIIVPVTASTQRRYEYEADAAAKSIGLGGALASALRKMGAFEGGRTGWEQTMAATHPPTELRLEALQDARPDDVEYQEDDLRVPRPREIRAFVFGLRHAVGRVEPVQTNPPRDTETAEPI
jgi:Zn-dependent protease with chaperone function